MLQIATGKFYTHEIGRQNLLRGVLYTNLRASFDGVTIETAAGSLKPSTAFQGIRSFTYEVIERIEGGPEPGAIVSVGADVFLRDMAAVTSFGLNITCTPDPDLARRLIGDPPLGPNTISAPKKYVARVFDADVWMQEGEGEKFQEFVGQLIGLERQHYLGAIRAIRTYVTGLQRIGDDIDLAYTLLVASIESLAQGFDGHRSRWEDFDHRKRAKIDEALDGADAEVADRVRRALLEVEHVALARRFRTFVLDNLTPSFFRSEAVGQVRAIGKADLVHAIGEAYAVRSKYIHTLAEVPRLIRHVWDHADYVHVERKPYLTLHGLARVARHLILEFVRKGPQVEKEEYSYRLDFPNIVQMEMAPQYWVWQHEGFQVQQARRRLEGLLQLIVGLQQKQPDAQFADLRPLLRKFEDLIPSASPSDQKLMIATYYLFNSLVRREDRLENAGTFDAPYLSLLDPPSIEGLAVRLAMEREVEWSADELSELQSTYYRRRYRPNGFELPPLYEAALGLALAEAHRREGDLSSAVASVEVTIDNLPNMAVLAQVATELAEHPDRPVSWETILLPGNEEGSDEIDRPAEGTSAPADEHRS